MKKDNKRMKKTTYIKRIMAIVLSVAMLISMTPEVFAEPLAATESEIPESAAEDTIGNTESDSQPGTADESVGSADSESTGNEETESSAEELQETTSEENAGTGESEDFTNGDSVVSGEESTETIAPDDAASEESASEDFSEMSPEDLVEDESEMVSLPMLLEEGASSSTSPSLTLNQAKNIAGTGTNAVLSQSDDTLTAAGAAGLILLSNIQPNDYKDLNIALKTTVAGWDVTQPQGYTYTEDTAEGETTKTVTCSFLGLGGVDYPYAGTMTILEGSTGYSITADRALFNAISSDAFLPDNINFMMAGNNSGQIVLADQVIKGNKVDNSTLECKVTLTTATGDDAVKSDTIGGIIGTLKDGVSASVILTNNLTGTSETSGNLTVLGGDNRGLFCNTMNANSSLMASLTNSGNATITVSATSGDAGGYVGKMSDNNTLTISGRAVNAVTSNSGNAGGLVGSATNATIQVVEGKTPFDLSEVEVTAANNKSAGGLVGEYSTSGGSLNLSHYKLSNITLSGGTNVGGLFGMLTNSGSYTVSNGSVTSKMTSCTNYGGMIGKYEAKDRSGNPVCSASLCFGGSINKITIKSTGGNNASTYGGMIGTVSGSSYVAMDDVSVSTAEMPVSSSSNFGGLVGQMADGLLNVGNVVMDSNGIDIAYDNINGRGGLVGAITKGVLRLHGTTDLTSQKITTAYHHTGQIVGNNGNGLVYAVGSGNSFDENGNGWVLKRYNDSIRSGSDIGNWGEVVRLDGTTLKETMGTDESALFVFDQANHSVTVQGATVDSTTDPSTNTVILEGIRDFAAYALAFNLKSGTEYANNSGTLIFINTVNPTVTQNVTLSSPDTIDLSGTGILGIGKDDDKQYCNPFNGTFIGNGNNTTIKLDIGSTYGKVGDNAATGNGSGQIYMRRASSREGHTSLALFPYTRGAIVSNLAVEGIVNCLIAKNGNNSEEKWPVFAAGAVGIAEERTTFDNVTVRADISLANEGEGESKNLYVMQGGILGQYAGSDTLSFTGCSWTSTLKNIRTTNNNRVGGFAGRVLGNSNVEVSNCTLSGTITSIMTGNAAVGGLFAESLDRKLDGTNFLYTDGNSISISNLTVSGANISATSVTKTCGGLLGYSWNKTDVTFGGTKTNGEGITTATTGVEINNSNLNSGSKATFGGLVYQATGYWNAKAANSIHIAGTNIITGGTSQNAPSGLLVGTGLITSNNQNNALYMEVGTWGRDGAYNIERGAVNLTLNGNAPTNESYFDELVGTTIYNNDNADHDNAVVSLATPNHLEIDKDGCNTYVSQIGTDKNFKNSKTRYYYNLDIYRASDTDGALPTAGNLNSPAQVLSWSVSQYAASNIRDYFCSNLTQNATITGSIDLTGYSYYPVTPHAGVTVGSNDTPTTLTLACDTIETTESGNKKPSDSAHQHYLMHHGLLYNTGSNVTVNNTTIVGTVGQLSSNSGSGALIFGSVTGDPTKNPVEVTLKDVTLAGLCVAGVIKDTTTYAPLLINKITQVVKLNVNSLSTGAGYTADRYAATSLIGNVGNANATKLTLTFSNIALDGRTEAATGATKVYNNGNMEVNYNTTHTIFTNATLLETFMYQSEGFGTYNFNSTDAKVTYGVELSNSDDIGRNPDKQHQYYDAFLYVTDEKNKTDADETYVKERYTSNNFIRYVHDQQSVNDKKYELDINQKTTGLLTGCGTYGDPYIITDPSQLISLANYINEDKRSSVTSFEVVFNSEVLSKKKQTTTSYHINGGATTNDTGTDTVYTWDGLGWKSADSTTVDSNTALHYLQNAYYQIRGDFMLPADKFAGLGTLANPFSGVIVGENNNTISITGKNEEQTSFGGLIRYSQGSVVKDLTVDYTKAKITMSNTGIPGYNGNNPFLGGVVGYCMGGDTIIDNVSVNYGMESVTLSGEKRLMIAAGGYVGLVGGAKESDGYEKTGGGVVFRNMGNHSNNFENTLPNAGIESPTLIPDSENYADNSYTNSTYFFCNRYVGRVLDGYACYDGGTTGQSTLDNTDKNYTIPDVPSNDGGLVVTLNTEGSLSANVSTAQGLWLLSSIVNSGAGAMDDNGTYQDVNSEYVKAYQYGKPRSRTANYNKIGTSITDSEKTVALADEIRWGGVAGAGGKDQSRVSYLVSGFTNETGDIYYAARLTGKGSSDMNNSVVLTFAAGTIDMSLYKNGFRGIGASYTVSKNLWDFNAISLPKNYRRALCVNGINVDSTSTTTITLNMSQREYHPGDKRTDYENGFWNQGAGLFTAFSYTSNAQVENLKLSGTVCLNTFDPNSGILSKVYKGNYDFCVGGFSGLISNSSGMVTFTNLSLENLNVYGGTTTGGVFGITSGSELTFSSFQISNVNVIKTVTNDGSIGGLVGLKRGKVTIGDKNNQTSIQSLTVKMFGTKTGTQDCGGLIGCSDGGDLTIQNIQATNLTVYGEDTRDVGGLVSGFRQKGTLTISDCKLTNLSVTYKANTTDNTGDDYRNVGGLVGYVNQNVDGISNVNFYSSTMSVTSGNSLGGFVGCTQKDITLNDCHISGSLYLSGRTKPYLGGMVGRSNTSGTITIKNCTEEDLNILSSDSDAGGLVGQMQNGSTKASNIVFSNVIVATGNNGKSVGLLTGHTNGREIYGYNILAKKCTVGYNTSATIENLGEITSTGKYNGLWLGGSKEKDNKLVAVAVDGTNKPQKDVGMIESGTVDITYADYPVVTGEETATGYPHLDVNPQGTLSVKESASTIAKTLTGNGVGTTTLTDEEGNTTTITVKGNSIAQTILEEVISTDISIEKKYWNLTETGTYPKFIKTPNETSNGGDAYVITYQNEEKGNTTVPSGTDFPILVVSGLANADTEIWDYIAALTNVKDGGTAKGQAESVDASTYKWTKDKDATEGEDGTFAGSFVKQETRSLNADSSTKKISIAKNAFDNQQSQFTLLTVKYKNPTTTTTNSAGDYFYLYVPVLVKKVLYTSFSAKFLAGTNYLKDDYMPFKKDTHATAGFNEPVTAYIEYNYDRSKSDWEKMLENGDDLLWYYHKVLDLAKNNKNDTPLPDDTRLTLVDKQTGQCYIHTFVNKNGVADTTGDDVHAFDLSKMTLDGTTGTKAFQPLPICDLLGLTIDKQLDTAKTAYVSLGEEMNGVTPEGATVKVDNTYYRMATDEEKGDTTKSKFTISVGFNLTNNTTGTNYLPQGEGYYLTIQVPSNNKASVVNNPVNVNSSTMKGTGAPLASIRNPISSSYVIYDGVQQSTFTISTSRNGSSALDTKMEDGDNIQVTLSSTLSLTESGKEFFSMYAPTELDHQFNINMKKHLKADTVESVEDVQIGATGASYTYTITKSGETQPWKTIFGTESGSEFLDKLSIGCDSDIAKDIVTYLKENKDGALTIEAVITLPYPTLGMYFPGRSGAEDDSGISVAADSRVANATIQLPITTNKKVKEDAERYYTQNPSRAKLTYNTYDGDGTGDSTRKLGINPSDMTDDLDGIIYTNGNYDYSSVDAETLTQAKDIKYTLELFRKDNDGSYNEGNPLERINEYLPYVEIVATDTAQVVKDNSDNSVINKMTWTKGFNKDDSGHEGVNIKLRPLTGTEFESESKKFVYANYKVRLTAVLLDGTGKELTDTRASDYIIYTNARIYPQIMPDLS